MFPLRILRVRGLAGSSVVRGRVGTGMCSTFLLGVLYLQHVDGYGALHTGLAFVPLTLLIGLFSLGVTARLMRQFGAIRVCRRPGRDRRRARAALAPAHALELVSHDRAARPRRGPLVPASDHDRDGQRAGRQRRSGFRAPQRPPIDLSRDRHRGPRHGGGRACRVLAGRGSPTSKRSPAVFTWAGPSPPAPAPSALAHWSRCCRCVSARWARGGGDRPRSRAGGLDQEAA